MLSVDCFNCSFPIGVENIGSKVKCPYCHTIGIAVKEDNVRGKSAINNSIGQGVQIPTWLFAGTIGTIIGIILGPTILASTREGAEKLARLSAEKLRK